MTKKIGIIGAMDDEISWILKEDLRNLKIEKRANRTFYCGLILGIECVVAVSKVGKVSAALTTSLMIHHFGVDEVIFTGTAGAVDPSLNIGDIIIANQLIQHDIDARPFFPRFEVPLSGLSLISSSLKQTEKLEHAAQNFIDNIKEKIPAQTLSQFEIQSPKIHKGTIASGDQFLSNPAHIQELSLNIPHLKAVEMEGAALAYVCQESQIPFAILRIVSDKADHSSHIDFPQFLEKISGHYSQFIVENYLRNCL